MAQFTPDVIKKVLEYEINTYLNRGIVFEKIWRDKNDYGQLTLLGLCVNGEIKAIFTNCSGDSLPIPTFDAFIRRYNSGEYVRVYNNNMYAENQLRNLRDAKRNFRNLLNNNNNRKIW